MSNISSGGTPFRIGSVFSHAFSVFGQAFWPIMALAVIPYILIFGGGFAVGIGIASNNTALLVAASLALFFLFVAYLVCYAAAIYGTISKMRQQQFQMGAALSACFRRTLPILGVLISVIAVMMLGTILLVVPGLIAMCVYYVVLPACVTGVCATVW